MFHRAFLNGIYHYSAGQFCSTVIKLRIVSNRKIWLNAFVIISRTYLHRMLSHQMLTRSQQTSHWNHENQNGLILCYHQKELKKVDGILKH